jgi:uncharacterized protein YjiS (DUF1127 family)
MEMIVGESSKVLVVRRAPINRVGAFFDRVHDGARRLWRAFWDHQARQATAMILHALDDRTLADMGLQRGEIVSAVFGAPPDRVRPYLFGWNLRAGG